VKLHSKIAAAAVVAATAAMVVTACNNSPVEAVKEAVKSDDNADSSASTGLPRSPSAEGASLTILSPQDGDILSGPVTVVFGLEGMGVAPAGIDSPNTGHHHLIINAELPDMGLPIPADDNYRHYGGGQTETSIELEPGTHTLQLLLGNYLHIPHDPPVVSDAISITVK
jgi:hypothetical protein